MPEIRVLIVDDHALFREGVRMLLERMEAVVVVGEAATGEEAVEKAREMKPDIVLMDITMPGMNGLQATRRICGEAPRSKVLVLTMHATESYLFEALKAGASGYVLKEGASRDLWTAIDAVCKGHVFVYPSMTRLLVEDFLQRLAKGQAAREEESYSKLSSREREILALIAQGYTNQEIADRLVLSVNTVQTHRTHIMEKLDLHSRAALMRYALRAGLMEQG